MFENNNTTLVLLRNQLYQDLFPKILIELIWNRLYFSCSCFSGTEATSIQREHRLRRVHDNYAPLRGPVA